LSNCVSVLLVGDNASDGVLVLSVDLSFIRCLSTLVDLVLESLESAAGSLRSENRSGGTGIELLDKLPASLALEESRIAIVADAYNAIFRSP